MAELNAVADAVARDKDPVPQANLQGVVITDADLPENLQPAPVQVPVAAPAQVIAAETGEQPATKEEYSNFVNNRAAKIARDKLAGVKNASMMLKDYFLKGSGKSALPKISAATFEALLAPLETAPDLATIVAILKK